MPDFKLFSPYGKTYIQLIFIKFDVYFLALFWPDDPGAVNLKNSEISLEKKSLSSLVRIMKMEILLVADISQRAVCVPQIC